MKRTRTRATYPMAQPVKHPLTICLSDERREMEYYRGMMIGGLVVSGWVLVCPWVIADASAAPGSWNFHIAGALALLIGIVALVRSDDLPEYGLLAVAVWLVISPWVLDLSAAVTRQAVFYGVILGGLAWFGRPSYKPKGAAA
jgi:hypothetical protein